MGRNIAIVGDGGTDRAIFRKIVEVILGGDNQNNINFVELIRQHSLRESVDIYWKAASKTNNYYLPNEHALKLLNEVANTLIGAFSDFESQVGIGEVSHQDILILTTDAERSFNQPDDYFQDRGCSISMLLMGGVEKFYSIKAIQGYSCEFLPIVIPIVTFPSTEILVAAAKSLVNAKNYNKKPSELKNLLYGTTNLATLNNEDLKEKALDFINPESINRIFQCVPESRLFIQNLSLGKIIAGNCEDTE